MNQDLTPTEREVIFQLARMGEMTEAQTAMTRSTIDQLRELREQIAQANAAIDATLQQLRIGTN